MKGAIGLVLAGVGLRNYYADDGDNRRYKNSYVVSGKLVQCYEFEINTEFPKHRCTEIRIHELPRSEKIKILLS